MRRIALLLLPLPLALVAGAVVALSLSAGSDRKPGRAPPGVAATGRDPLQPGATARLPCPPAADGAGHRGAAPHGNPSVSRSEWQPEAGASAAAKEWYETWRVVGFEDDLPIAGARVELRRRSGSPSAERAVSSSDGSFDLPLQTYAEIVVRAEGRATAYGYPWRGGCTPSAPSAMVFHLHRRGGAARGLLTDDKGSPVAGLRVRLQPLSHQSFGQFALLERSSDDHGRVEFPGLPQGVRFLPITWDSTGSEVHGPPIAASGADLDPTFEMVVPRRVELAGRVLLEDGQPPSLAWVEAVTADGHCADETWTDEDGGFELAVPVHRALRVRAGVGPGPQVGCDVSVRDKPLRLLDLVLEGQPHLRVQLVREDASAEPVEGVDLVLRAGAEVRHSSEDGESWYRFHAVPRGEPLELELDPWNRGELRILDSRRESAAGALEWTVRVAPASARVRGHVRFAGAAEGAEAAVRIFDEQGLLEECEVGDWIGEEFESDPLPPGPIRIEVLALGYSVQECGPFALRAGEDLDLGVLALQEAPPLRGRVVDGLGRGLALAEVELWLPDPEDKDDQDFWSAAVADAEGWFALESVARKGLLVVRAPSGIWQVFPAPVSASAKPLLLTCFTGRLRGIVIDGRGEGIPYLDVFAFPAGTCGESGADSIGRAATVTGPDGAFELTHVPFGPVDLEFGDRDFEQRLRQIRVEVQNSYVELGPVRINADS